MPKSEILNGLEFVERHGNLEALNSFGFVHHSSIELGDSPEVNPRRSPNALS
ncbi:MAG TPA: hypothetical protein VHT68_24725 [Pseudolabrys sp.]|jgi:hypothetical protein|nr:hypothetical protein [Pseudolabrys sp.]